MTTKNVTIEVNQGAGASPVAKCVQLASQFESKIYIEQDTKKVNAKSIMGMMALGIAQGSAVVISAEGEDETAAIDALAGYLQNVC